MWGKIELFLDDYSLYDILGFSFTIILGFLFIVLAIALRKNILAMILMLLLAIGTFAGGPFAMSYMVDTVTRKTVIDRLEIKQLNFTKALVVSGSLRNAGKIALRDCKVVIEVWKKSNSDYKEYVRMFQKPKRKKEFMLTNSLPLRSSQDFRVVYDNFRSTENMDIIVKGKCR
jgi:hypothetical protein